jgi:hypothetical protein
MYTAANPWRAVGMGGSDVHLLVVASYFSLLLNVLKGSSPPKT